MPIVICENCGEETYVEEDLLDVNEAADKLLQRYTGERPSVLAVETLAEKIKEILVTEFRISSSLF